MTVDEWDHREVCPDGACTGVIGLEGRCKVCGHVLPAWNNERERGLVEPASTEADAPGGDDDSDESDSDKSDKGDKGDKSDKSDKSDNAVEDERDAALAPAASTDDHEWSRRILCSDGACVGVIGPGNVCTVCGKPPA